MIRRAFDDIQGADLTSLVSNHVSEGRSLESKRALPGGADAEVKEFLADVTSLANAQGGDLIFGVEEENGTAHRLPGLKITDADAAILRLENILRDGIEPRLAGVRIRWVALQQGKGAIVLRAPGSLTSPHRVRFRNSGRFFSRNSRGKYEMDTHELRQAFTASEELPAKLRQLHHRAVDAARGIDFPFRLPPVPSAVLSVIPLSFLRERQEIDVTEVNAVLPPHAGGAMTYLHTLEGVLFRTPLNPDNTVRAYALTHRLGRVDAPWTIGGVRERNGDKLKLVWPKSFRDGVLDIARTAISRLHSFGIEGPWLFLASVIGAKGFCMVVGDYAASDPAW